MQTQNQTNQQVLAQIVAAISGSSIATVNSLIDATNPVKGCRFVSLTGYNSDASDNTEIANHVVNIGFQYEAMKEKDEVLLRRVNLQRIDVDSYRKYHLINTGKLSLDEYKRSVRAHLNLAFAELLQSATAGPSTRENNDIYLNKVLVFNTKTSRLSLIGQEISKTVVVEGEQKITAKSPKTVAKELIKNAAGLRTNTYRRFAIDNLNECKINGDTIEVR